MIMAGMVEWHRNKQYTVISEFIITGVCRTAYHDTFQYLSLVNDINSYRDR